MRTESVPQAANIFPFVHSQRVDQIHGTPNSYKSVYCLEVFEKLEGCFFFVSKKKRKDA